MPRLPFVIVGDAPGQSTGMSRIATELAARLWSEREELGVDLLHVGQLHGVDGMPKSGLPVDVGVPWSTWCYQQSEDFGDTQLGHALNWKWGKPQQGVVLAVQDPARSFSLLKPLSTPDRWQRWGYFSVDGVNRNGVIGGPAAEAIKYFHRVAGYSRFGQHVLQRVRGDGPNRMEIIPSIPHGVNPYVFHRALTPEEYLWTAATLNPSGREQVVLGCVATNQPRKDLWLFFEVLWQLHAKGLAVRGWLHVDREIGPAWSVPQLAADTGVDWKTLTVTTQMTERQLACCYSLCSATLAPGRGEGFGYPILESLACGCPVVHADDAAGAELLPAEWRVPVRARQATGPYGILRPVLGAEETAAVVEQALEVSGEIRAALSARARQQFGTETIWRERMRPWIQAGLEALRGDGEGV